jgi:hypothetical protein
LQGLSGAAASLEVVGLILACGQTDQQCILSGNLRFRQLWTSMSGLAPANVNRLVAEVRMLDGQVHRAPRSRLHRHGALLEQLASTRDARLHVPHGAAGAGEMFSHWTIYAKCV